MRGVSKQLRLENVRENLHREKKRREFKKIQIIEKQARAVEKINIKKKEEDLIQKAKVEAKNQSVKSQMEK